MTLKIGSGKLCAESQPSFHPRKKLILWHKKIPPPCEKGEDNKLAMIQRFFYVVRLVYDVCSGIRWNIMASLSHNE